MTIKLICIDMDGTLLKDEQEIAQEDQEAVKFAVSQGVHVAITTGRVYNCARLYAKTIGLTTPIIASNGAFIGGSDGQEIYCNPLEMKDVRYFLEVTQEQGLLSYLTANFGIVSTIELPETNIYKVLNQRLNEDERIRLDVVTNLDEIEAHYSGEILKGVCLGDDEAKLIAAKEALKAKCPHLEVVSSWHNNFEIMKKGSSKGEAVAQLAKYFEVDPAQVMCIGDSENDLSMLKFAGAAVAMGNAREDVKAVADYITADNKHAGVAQAIYHFLKE